MPEPPPVMRIVFPVGFIGFHSPRCMIPRSRKRRLSRPDSWNSTRDAGEILATSNCQNERLRHLLESARHRRIQSGTHLGFRYQVGTQSDWSDLGHSLSERGNSIMNLDDNPKSIGGQGCYRPRLIRIQVLPICVEGGSQSVISTVRQPECWKDRVVAPRAVIPDEQFCPADVAAPCVFEQGNEP